MSNEILSPCVSICTMEDDVCIGCFRTLEEIAKWSDETDVWRSRVIESLAKREEDLFG